MAETYQGIRMILQAALNGDFTKTSNPALPITPDELERDAVACVSAGANAIHLHPRDDVGLERLDSEVIDGVVARVRAACGVPVGVTTGAWIEPDLERRLRLIEQWRVPDYASVNLSEPGSLRIMETMLRVGVGIEAGVWTVEDAEQLGESGLGGRVTRILVEPGELQVGSDTSAALKLVDDIHRTLDRFGLTVPRLQHGDGAVAWVILSDAIRRGLDTRIGFEDTIYLPNGELSADNQALVRAARALGAG